MAKGKVSEQGRTAGGEMRGESVVSERAVDFGRSGPFRVEFPFQELAVEKDGRWADSVVAWMLDYSTEATPLVLGVREEHGEVFYKHAARMLPAAIHVAACSYCDRFYDEAVKGGDWAVMTQIEGQERRHNRVADVLIEDLEQYIEQTDAQPDKDVLSDYIRRLKKINAEDHEKFLARVRPFDVAFPFEPDSASYDEVYEWVMVKLGSRFKKSKELCSTLDSVAASESIDLAGEDEREAINVLILITALEAAAWEYDFAALEGEIYLMDRIVEVATGYFEGVRDAIVKLRQYDEEVAGGGFSPYWSLAVIQNERIWDALNRRIGEEAPRNALEDLGQRVDYDHERELDEVPEWWDMIHAVLDKSLRDFDADPARINELAQMVIDGEKIKSESDALALYRASFPHIEAVVFDEITLPGEFAE